MKNHKCNEICQLLSPYLDQALSSEEMNSVKEHLDSCPQCKKEYLELLELKRMMDEIRNEEMEVPEDFLEGIMAKIELEETDKEKKQSEGINNLIDTFFKKPWIPAVIAAMLLIALYLPSAFGPFFQMGGSKEDSAQYSEALDNGINAVSGMTRSALPAPEPQLTADNMKMMDAAETEEAATVERKIIKNAFLTIDVTDYKVIEEQIIEKTRVLGGYVAGSNSYYYGAEQDLLAGSISVRLPEERFDEMLIFLENLGKVKDKNTYTNDVTEEYMDIETRIKNLEIKEQRLLEILTKQGELKDLLAVENEIAETRAEIERLSGRLKYLSSQVAYSSVEINLREVRNIEESISKDTVSGLGTRIKEAVIKSLNLLLDFAVKGVLLISSALPFLLILIVLYFILRVFWKKKNRDL